MKLASTLLGFAQAISVKEHVLHPDVLAQVEVDAVNMAFNQMHLDKHNEYRALHGADPLVYDQSLAAAAQAWSEDQSSNDQMQHDSNRGNAGENLAMYWSSNAETTRHTLEETTFATDAWYNELTDPGYNFNDPGFSSGTGHFTQVVWKGTQKLGCGVSGKFITCRYSPPGNYGNQFVANVLPLDSTTTPNSDESESDSDEEERGCQNTDNGAKDSYGDPCSAYVGHEGWCAGYDVASPLFDSCSMCCACKSTSACQASTSTDDGSSDDDSSDDDSSDGGSSGGSGDTSSAHKTELDNWIESKNLPDPFTGCGISSSMSSNGARTLKEFHGGCFTYKVHITFVLT